MSNTQTMIPIPEAFSPPSHNPAQIREPEESLTMLWNEVQSDPGEEDFEKHYNLGIAYKEMGLLDDACREFMIASKDPKRELDCIIKMGRCYSRKGEYEIALAEFRKGLALPDRSNEAYDGLRYEIIKVYEQRGEHDRAADELRHLHSVSKPSERGDACRVRTAELYAAPKTRLSTLLFYLLSGIAIVMGWQARDSQYLTAESGLGYTFGIVGTLLMLLLLLYPLRKKLRFFQRWGAIKYWFQIHMILGIIGPILILFHANFHLGSLNSRVALFSTLLVAVSGIWGLFFYSKIHYGLFGKQVTLKELQWEIEVSRNSLKAVFNYAPKLKEKLFGFETRALDPSYNVLQSIGRMVIIGFWTRWIHLRLWIGLRRAIRVTARRTGWPAHEYRWQKKAARRQLSAHMRAVLKIAEFSFFERVFALWHIFHLPLFFMLVLVALLHVVAVHLY